MIKLTGPIYKHTFTSASRSVAHKMSVQPKYKLADLPLPARALQGSLEQIPLDGNSPRQQRRSQTFARTGFWARVTPLPLPFPFTYEALAGRAPEPTTQADADALFAAFDEYDEDTSGKDALQLALKSSRRRREAFNPILLGISSSCLSEALPHLDIDHQRLDGYLASKDASKAPPEDIQDLVSVCGGRSVLRSAQYGPWSTRYAGHQFGQWAGQLGDGRAISICESEIPLK